MPDRLITINYSDSADARPPANSLRPGELAVNAAKPARLFVGGPGGTVVQLSGPEAAVDPTEADKRYAVVGAAAKFESVVLPAGGGATKPLLEVDGEDSRLVSQAGGAEIEVEIAGQKAGRFAAPNSTDDADFLTRGAAKAEFQAAGAGVFLSAGWIDETGALVSSKGVAPTVAKSAVGVYEVAGFTAAISALPVAREAGFRCAVTAAAADGSSFTIEVYDATGAKADGRFSFAVF